VHQPNVYNEVWNIFQNLASKDSIPRERENPMGSILTYQTLTRRVICFGLLLLDRA
jgi:hypothetical protein